MTASTIHSTALAAIEAALEVEAAATPGPWESNGAAPLMVPGLSLGERAKRAIDAADARAIVLARALVRRSLLNAKETLEQHQPEHIGGIDWCTGTGHHAPWVDCPDAQRALALVDDIPEGGAK